MSSSMLIVVLVVIAGLLYVLLRRRGGGASEPMRSLPQHPGPVAKEEPDLRPFRPAAGERTGLPPRGPGPDSASSHPAYPVAPAKYAGASPAWTEAVTRPESDSGARRAAGAAGNSRPASSRVKAGPAMNGAPPATKPWYPEPPADYAADETGSREGDEAGGTMGKP